MSEPASVAQLDAYPTDIQDVAGSIQPDRQHSFLEIWLWNIFYGHSLPSADLSRVVVSFWGKNVHITG